MDLRNPKRVKSEPPLVLRNPKPNCHKDLPQDVWTVVASFLLPPHERWDLQLLVTKLSEEGACYRADVEDASMLMIESMRKIAENFWDELEAIHSTRTDEDLAILEQLVANDRSPLANQLRIGRESLQQSFHGLPFSQELSELFRDKEKNQQKWHEVYTFLLHLLGEYPLRKDFIAVAIWVLFATPSLPITIAEYEEALRFIEGKLAEYESKLPCGYESCRMIVMTKDLQCHFRYHTDPSTHEGREYNDLYPHSHIDASDLWEEAIKRALGWTYIPGKHVTVVDYIDKNANLIDSISLIHFTCKTVSDEYYEEFKPIFFYFYLLVIYRYGSFHPVTKHMKEILHSRSGNIPLPEIYTGTVDFLEEYRRKKRGVDTVLRYSWDDESDVESSDSELQRRCLYIVPVPREFDD